MKKLFIIFAIFLLAFSTVVIADRDDTPLRDNDRARDQVIDDNDKPQNTRVIAARTIAKRKVANIREAKQKLTTAKERYVNAKKNYKDKKTDLARLKAKYQECLTSETDECKQYKKNTKRTAIEHLTNSADLILEKLEELKTKIQSSTDLTEEEVNEIIGNLDEKINEVEEAKATLENVNEDTPKEEIKEAAVTIKNAWNKAKLHVHKSRMRHVGAMLKNLINKAEIFGERVQAKASELNDEELNSMIEDYDSKVQNAKEQHQLAKEKWQTATTPTEIDNIRREVHTYLKEANNYLKQSREKLREIIRNLKQNNEEVSLDVEEVEE